MLENITIPEKLWLGLQSNEHDLPKGNVAPWGEDKQGLNRKRSVQPWSYAGRKVAPVKIITNEPIAGFRIASHSFRSWANKQEFVSIQDPRGFISEIMSGNLVYLTKSNSIVDGEIVGRCVWARTGKWNVLLSEHSQPYIDAVELTQRKKTKLSIKDVQIGNRIKLQNGHDGVYLGKYTTLLHENTPSASKEKYDKHLVWSPTRFLVHKDDESKNQILLELSSFSASDIIDHTTMTQEDALNFLREKSFFHSSNQAFSSADVVCRSQKPFDVNEIPVHLAIEPATVDDIRTKCYGVTAIYENKGKVYKFVHWNAYKSDTFSAIAIDKSLLETEKFIRKSNLYPSPNNVNLNINDGGAFYKLHYRLTHPITKMEWDWYG